MGISVRSVGRARSGRAGARRISTGSTRLAAAVPVPTATPTLSLGRAIKSAGGGGKRRFRGFSVSDPFSESDPEGEDGPGLEFSINAFTLAEKKQALGMDESRKQAMRRLLWYWQWSRDWEWRQVSEAVSIQQDVSDEPVPHESEGERTEQRISAQWYWRWRHRVKAKRRLSQTHKVRLRARLLRDKLLHDGGIRH